MPSLMVLDWQQLLDARRANVKEDGAKDSSLS